MAKKYAHLLEPITIKGVTFRNRLFVAPHNHATQGGESYPTTGGIMHYANIARGGAALVNCGSTQVDPLLRDPRLPKMVAFNTYDLMDYEGLHYYAQQVDAIHHFGAKASIELTELPYGGWMIQDHTGDVIDGSFREAKLIRPVYGPHDEELPNGTKVHQMPEEEMNRIADAFADCAANAASVGFDSVLIHAGHGMLLSQFLCPHSNHRTDAYGGSHENRARFLRMVLERIRQKVGNRLIIELRISGDTLEPDGNHIEDVIKYLQLLEDLIDIAHISCGGGNYLNMTTIHPSDFMTPAPNIKYARAAKESGLLHIPVATIGGLQDLDLMEEILATGGADIISGARTYISDPDFAKHVYEETPEDIRPCIKCYSCLTGFVKTGLWGCSVNPTLGREHQLPMWDDGAHAKKRVAVIGGGPAGMQAAITACDQGHEVVLFEKNTALGGKINAFDHESFKRSTKGYKEYLIRQLGKRPIDVRTGTEATPDMIAKEAFDVVIPAIGAEHFAPSIPGIDGSNVVFADEVFENAEALGTKIVIIGGGLSGCEIACELGKQGKDVAVIEQRSRLAMDANNTYVIDVYRTMGELGTVQITNAVCRSIQTNGVVYEENGEEKLANADTVIIACGMKAKADEANGFYAAAKYCRPIGDCAGARNIMWAVREGYDAALCI